MKDKDHHHPPLKALILAGGKSSRMKEDKSKLTYHGVSQEEYMARMCESIGVETFISKSSQVKESSISGIAIIKDKYLDLGPFGAILSAFFVDPEAAWLVLACDLPYISKVAIEHLIKERSIQHFATAYRVQENSFPEPLIAIYEPCIYQSMLSFLSSGQSSPKKLLMNSEVKQIILADPDIAFNANTPEEKEMAINKLKSKV
ncbi:MAG: NTP transferase domain-containing protein [Bacteroidota bacterium]